MSSRTVRTSLSRSTTSSCCTPPSRRCFAPDIDPGPGDPLAPVRAVGGFLAANNQLGAYGFNEVIPGFVRLDTSQFQMTLTKIFQRVLWADSFTLVWEGAAQKVHDMPEKETFRLEGPGTFTSGNPIHQQARIQPGTEPLEAFPDDFSCGYVLAGRFDYNQAIGSMNLIPRFSFSHDVSGVSPGPGGNFIEDRMGYFSSSERPSLTMTAIGMSV